MSRIKMLSPIILAVLFAVGWVAWHAGQSVAPSTYRAGDRFLAPPGSQYASMERLVLFIDSRCPFCQASVPLYRKLFGSAAAERHELPVIVVGWEDIGKIQAFVSSNDLRASEVFSLSRLDQYAFRYTPTLLHVSAEGSVQDLWIGRVTREQEQRILRLAAIEN